tara:strand:- start:11749 stop:12228 length:480 start_codon:yes stop_codon:yes gene_type:complete
MEKKYHFIYKTTSKFNGKFYIGMHSTNDLEDGYMGSGTKLLKDIKQYGADRYTKEILEFAYSREELMKLESEILTEDVANNWYCLNKITGGIDYVKGTPVYVNRWNGKNGMGDTKFVDIIKEGEEPKWVIDRLLPYFESRGWNVDTTPKLPNQPNVNCG